MQHVLAVLSSSGTSTQNWCEEIGTIPIGIVVHFVAAGHEVSVCDFVYEIERIC
jgi:hypothetical protein